MPNIFSHRFLYASPLGDLAIGLCGGRLRECRWCPADGAGGSLPPGSGASATASAAPFAADAVPSVADAVPSAADAALEAMVRRQFDEYFRQQRRTFSLPLWLPGTLFRQSVWQALQRVPYGGRMSYRMLAEAVGNARAARAVAQACHHNPVAIVVPCHRIVGSDGSLVGYAGGLERKRRLLSLEAACPATALPHI